MPRTAAGARDLSKPKPEVLTGLQAVQVQRGGAAPYARLPTLCSKSTLSRTKQNARIYPTILNDQIIREPPPFTNQSIRGVSAVSRPRRRSLRLRLAARTTPHRPSMRFAMAPWWRSLHSLRRARPIRAAYRSGTCLPPSARASGNPAHGHSCSGVRAARKNWRGNENRARPAR